MVREQTHVADLFESVFMTGPEQHFPFRVPVSAKGWYVYPVARKRSAAAKALIAHLARQAERNLG